MRGSTAGLADTLSGGSRPYERLLSLLDACFAALVVAPLVVGYWRGTWNLVSAYLFPGELVKSSIASALIGFGLHLVFTLSQYKFRSSLDPDRKRLTYHGIAMLYTYIFGIGCINSWKGGWQLLDVYIGTDPKAVWTTTIAAALALAAMRCLKNIAAPPFAVVVDSPADFFEIPTMFRTSSKEMALYVLDCLFSVFVVGSLVLFVWRGVWALVEIYLYPGYPVWSAAGSLVTVPKMRSSNFKTMGVGKIARLGTMASLRPMFVRQRILTILGYAMVVISFASQTPMRWLCSRLHGVWRVVASDLFLSFSFIATVNVWRGIWQLMDFYFLAADKMASDWISHLVSLLILVTLNCSNSVLVRGVYIDAEEQGGECVIFPCHYLRLIIRRQRGEKRKRRIALAAAERHQDHIAAAQTLIGDIKFTDQPPIVRWDSNDHQNILSTIQDKKSYTTTLDIP